MDQRPPRGQWSRRRLLTTTMGIAATIPLASCAAGAGGADTRIRAAFPNSGAKESLDPHTSNLFIDLARAKALFDTLAAYAEDMTPIPRLAESWEADDTGTRWRVRLRQAVFHDGRPVTAEDVLYSYRRIADPATASPARKQFADVDFAASRTRSDRELEFVLTKPNFEFPSAFAAPATEVVPAGTTQFARPIGSGPFRFESFEPGGTAQFARFDGHWSGPAAAPGIEFLPINEESARTSALMSGQVHYAHDVSANSAQLIERDQRARVLSAQHATMQAVALKIDREPFSDARIIRAVQLGLQRQALVDVALSGNGTVGNDMYGKGLKYYAEQIPQRTRDIDRARALLSEAGAKDLRFNLLTSSSDPYFESAASLISQQLNEIGMTVTPQVRASETYFSHIKKNGVAAHTRTSTLPLTTFLGQRLYGNIGSTNYTRYRSPKFNALFDKALATRDEAERARLLAEAQGLARDHSGLIVWGFNNFNVAVSANLKGMRQAPPNSLHWARFDRASMG